MRARFAAALPIALAVVAFGSTAAGAAGPVPAHHDHIATPPTNPSVTSTTPVAVDPWLRTDRPKLTVVTRDFTVRANKIAKVTLSCSAPTACKGQRWLTVAGTATKKISYWLPARTQRTVSFTLSGTQYLALKATKTRNASVLVREQKPALLATTATSLRLRFYVAPVDPTGPIEPPAPLPSEAYANRNWTPTAADSCSAELHRTYSSVGPDGKLYPTWHPAVVTDPATGQSCTFGHEHGDDPSTSDIAGWVQGFLSDPAYPNRKGLPFGYVSERLTEYAGANAGYATRHEDNVGHKVIVANDVKLVAASPRGFVRFTDGDGTSQIVTCGYLIKIHQGTHSADATANNAHELLYAMKCNDGTAVISSTMTKFGDPNQFHRGCEPSTVVTTGGSVLPAGEGGERLIPDRWCVEKYVLVDPTNASAHTDPWGIYEVWQSVNELKAEDGQLLAAFDPWFGVRNPSRYFKGVETSINTIGRTVDLSWETESNGDKVNASPWEAHSLVQPFAATDPRSAFDGAERDFYLAQGTVSNAAGPTAWFTDPYGAHGLTVPFTGSVPQYVSSTGHTYPALERRIFDKEADFGAGLGVHAPN